MRVRPLSLTLVAVGTAAVTAIATSPVAAATLTGASTSTSPFVLPVAPGVDITSLLTVGDSKAAGNGYEMVGIPDGLGAYQRDGKTVLLMNHELRESQGITRAHGQKGAFVSQLTIDADGTVLAGEDLVRSVQHYRYVDGSYGPTPQGPAGATSGHTAAFSRFCSGSLTEPGQLLVGPGKDGNGKGQGRGNGKYGYDGQLFFGNEESGNEGRVFGITTDGVAYQLPRLGLFSWENTVAAPNSSRTTVVMGNEDATPGELWVYAGEKTRSGSPVDRAGLTNGRNFVVKVPGLTRAAGTNTDAGFRAAYPKGQAAPFSLQDIEWNQSGAAQNAEAVNEDGLGLSRIEDGQFSPSNPNEYYFVTTEGGDRTPAATGLRDGGGLWKLTFADVEKPHLGGTLELVLDGSEEWGAGESRANKPDNMTIDPAGNLLIQEDPGGNAHLARILAYRITDGARGVVARFDADRFVTGGSRFLTQDEESSGIIALPDGSYLFDAQVHTPAGLPAGTGKDTVEEYVENGQLLRMTVPSFSTVYTVLP